MILMYETKIYNQNLKKQVKKLIVKIDNLHDICSAL